MIVQEFLRGLQSISDTKPAYRLGGDGSDGTCDCIGLIIGALRRAGGKWTGAHGSNYAARHQMVSLTRSPPLEFGAVMFKAREPDAPGYSLPATYADDPDRRDYYHVGVVAGISPLRIIHCTSWSGGSGIKIDTAIGKWLYGGRIKGVNYKEAQEVQETQDIKQRIATINCPPGESVKLRQSPSTKAMWAAKIPSGETVEILSLGSEWHQVRWGGLTGYIMASFVRLDGSLENVPGEPDGDIVIPRAKWEAFLEAVDRVLEAVITS